MPLVHSSSFSPPRWARSPHTQTCLPRLFRRVPLNYQRERLELSDGDFVDIDRINQGNDRAVILNHGLEGSSESRYIRGMARALSQSGFDVFAWNYRGCSGTLNRLPRSYHSGETGDLHQVVLHARSLGYRSLSLIGFSLGANVTLKYLGEQGSAATSLISSAVVFSAPCDLKESAQRLSERKQLLYMYYFAQTLRQKLRARFAQFPELGDVKDIERCHTFFDFDSYYTAPAHGFRDAQEYWNRCSSAQYLTAIEIPTLIVNALDDPCLGPKCSPAEIVKKLPKVYLESPRWGGHNGFFTRLHAPLYWSETRALEFLAHPMLTIHA